MNNFPIPTDNLYKFCAVIGAIGFLALSIVMPYALVEKFLDKTNETELQISITEARTKGVKRYLDVIDSILKKDMAANKDTIAIHYDDASLRRVFELSLEKLIEQDELLAKSKILHTQEKYLLNKWGTARVSLFLGCGVSFILSFWGFYRWKRIQDLQDRVLEKQLESMGVDTAIKKKARKSKVAKS